MLDRRIVIAGGASGHAVGILLMVLWALHYGNAQLESTSYSDGNNDMSSMMTSSVTPSTMEGVLLTTPVREERFAQRQRDRLSRLEAIRLKILEELRIPENLTLSPNRTNVSDVLESFPNLTVLEQTTEQHHCYSASCHPPQSVNSTLWNDPNNLGLRLYIPVPREPDTEADAHSATLQLFLKPNPLSTNCPCFEGGEEEEEGQSTPNLLVSVYKFTRPLVTRRRGRIINRRRLLDARIARSAGSVWVSLNVISALRDWRRNRRNFGLEVTVKMDNDREIDAKQLFVQASCNAGREIGCLEDVSESESTKALPWNIDYLDNHPYVEITSRRRRVRRSGSQRSPLARKNARTDLSSAHAAPDVAPLANLSCSGESVRIKIRDERLIWPKYFHSYICPHSCWDCNDDRECTPRPCQRPKTEPLRGLIRPSAEARPRLAVLPFVRVVACGC